MANKRKPRLLFVTKCKRCGKKIDLAQDKDDAEKFHVECHNCGLSTTLTRIRESDK